MKCTEYDYNENIEENVVGNKSVSDEQLTVCIRDNSIGAHRLYNELKRRSISNINHK